MIFFKAHWTSLKWQFESKTTRICLTLAVGGSDPIPSPEESFICPCFNPSFVHILLSASCVGLTSGTCGTAVYLDIRSDRIRCHLLSPFSLCLVSVVSVHAQFMMSAFVPAAFQTSCSRFHEKIIGIIFRCNFLCVFSPFLKSEKI